MVASIEAVLDIAEIRKGRFPDTLAGVVVKLGDDEEITAGCPMRHEEVAQDRVDFLATGGRRHHGAKILGLDRRLIDQGLIQSLGLDEEGRDARQKGGQDSDHRQTDRQLQPEAEQHGDGFSQYSPLQFNRAPNPGYGRA